MIMLMNILAEALAAIAEFVAHTMTLGCAVMSMNEPKMPEQLLKK